MEHWFGKYFGPKQATYHLEAIYLTAIPLEMLMKVTTTMHLKITHFNP